MKWRAGETDMNNGTKFWTDCINVSMEQLTPPNEIINIWSDSPSHN